MSHKKTNRFFARNSRRIFTVAILLSAIFMQFAVINAVGKHHSRVLVQKSTSILSSPERAPIAEAFAYEAVDLNPYDGYAWFYLGTAKYLQNDFPEAVSLLTHGLDYLPHSYNSIRLLGFSNYQMQNFKNAAADFERYLTMMPSPSVSPDLVFNRAGLAKLRTNELDDASFYLIQATAAAEVNHDNLRGRMIAAVLSNRLGTAEYCAELFWFHAPDAELNPFDMLAGAMQTGKTSQATQFLETLINRNPGDVSVVKALAAAYSRSDREETAKDLILKAIQENPENASLHLAMGDLFYAEKRFDEAIIYYDEHLRLQPNSNFREDISRKKAEASRNQ